MNLLKITILSVLFLSQSPVQGAAESLQSYDLNQDGIKDRFEYSINEKIIRVEEDRDGDKKIDFKTFLDDKAYYKIQWQYDSQTGKLERKISHELLPESKSKIITEIDKDGDGVFEVKYERTINNIQKQDQCGEVSATIRDLSNTVLKAVAKNQKGLLPTKLGYKVDVECYNKWGDDFNKIVKEVAVTGLQCLADLDKKGKKGTATTGAIRNAFDLTKLMKNDGISLVCSENDYEHWSGTLAHASVSPNEVMTSKNIKHPFVSINPKYPEMPIADRAKEITELKDTIFHETLHNLGYAHNEDIEFSYTCGTCCFDKEAEPALKSQSCKICTGNYKNASDINYVKDMVDYSQLKFDNARGAAAVIKYLKENDKNASGVALLSYATSGAFNPVGPELAKLVAAKNPTLAAEDKAYLQKAALYADTVEFKSAKASTSALSNALYELYYNKNGANAMATLEKNQAAIKQELAKIKTAGGNNEYIHDEIKNVLDRMIFDMWINKYPDASVSNRAYALDTYFK